MAAPFTSPRGLSHVHMGVASILKCIFASPATILRTPGIVRTHMLSDAACDAHALEAIAREAVAVQGPVAVIAHVHTLMRAIQDMNRRTQPGPAAVSQLLLPSQSERESILGNGKTVRKDTETMAQACVEDGAAAALTHADVHAHTQLQLHAASSLEVAELIVSSPAWQQSLRSLTPTGAVAAVRHAGAQHVIISCGDASTHLHKDTQSRGLVQAHINSNPHVLTPLGALAASSAGVRTDTAPTLPGRGGTQTAEALASDGLKSTPPAARPASSANEKAFMDAARAGDVSRLRDMLAQANSTMTPDATASARVCDPESGASALHHFVVSAAALDSAALSREGIELLVEQGGADVDVPSGNGSTPLHWAAGAGNLAAVEELIARGANPAARTYTWRRQVFGRGSGQTPLHWAAESNQPHVIEVLSRSMLFPSAERDERQQTPVDLARKELAFHAEQSMERLSASAMAGLVFHVEGSAAQMLK